MVKLNPCQYTRNRFGDEVLLHPGLGPAHRSGDLASRDLDTSGEWVNETTWDPGFYHRVRLVGQGRSERAASARADAKLHQFRTEAMRRARGFFVEFHVSRQVTKDTWGATQWTVAYRVTYAVEDRPSLRAPF